MISGTADAGDRVEARDPRGSHVPRRDLGRECRALKITDLECGGVESARLREQVTAVIVRHAAPPIDEGAEVTARARIYEINRNDDACHLDAGADSLEQRYIASTCAEPRLAAARDAELETLRARDETVNRVGLQKNHVLQHFPRPSR
jgi:hypothetical protein